jgi:S1-C subfamily serine protease
MHSDQSYKLMWRGIESGPLSIAEIRQQLIKGELHSMYLIQVGGDWLLLRDYLETAPAVTPSQPQPTVSGKELRPQHTSPPVETQQTRSTPPPLPGYAASAQSALSQGRQNISKQQSKLAEHASQYNSTIPQSQSRSFWVGVGSASAAILLVAGLLWSLAGSKSVSEAMPPTNETEVVAEPSKPPSRVDDDKDLKQAWKLWTGDGVTENAHAAVQTFKRLAEAGNPPAQFSYGFALFVGHGILKDHADAIRWWKKAAASDVSHAQFALGCAYSKGEGVAANESTAVQWFQKASMLGHPQAQFWLGVANAIGNGTAVDAIKAFAWFRLSSNGGYQPANKALEELSKTLNGSQVAAADRLVNELKTQLLSKDNLEVTPDIMSNFSGTGTGFFITTNGYLVTNFHVVEKASIVKVKTSTGLKTAKIISTDPDSDLALLKLEGSYEALPVSPGKNVALGSTVTTVGFPMVGLMGLSPKFAKGEITSLAGIQDDQRYFQISVPVQPGNSGGALINEKGNVVGIVSAKLDAAAMLQSSGALPENVNYAVKSSLLIELLKKVPDAFSKLHKESSLDRKFEDVVKVLEKSSALILVN